MSNLQDKIEQLEEQLTQLKKQAEKATCAEIGHDMQCSGYRSACCEDDCCCSVPVYNCRWCGGSDFGDNQEAIDVIEHCKIIGRNHYYD